MEEAFFKSSEEAIVYDLYRRILAAQEDHRPHEALKHAEYAYKVFRRRFAKKAKPVKKAAAPKAAKRKVATGGR
jgi:hypothetical protein